MILSYFVILIFSFLFIITPSFAQMKQEVKPEVVVQTGHNTSIKSFEISSNGKYLVSLDELGINTNKIIIWDLTCGKELYKLYPPRLFFTSITLSNDGKYLFSGDSYGNIIKWDIFTGKLIKYFIKDSLLTHGIQILSVSPDSKYIAKYCAFQPIVVYDSNNQIRPIIMKNNIRNFFHIKTNITFSSDSRFIAAGGVEDSSEEFTIHIWEINSGEIYKILKKHNDRINYINFSLDNSKIISCSDDSTIKIWDIKTSKLIKSIYEHKDKVKSVAYCPDTKIILSMSRNNTIKIWDELNYHQLASFESNNFDANTLKFSPDGNLFFLGGINGDIEIWNTKTKKMVNEFKNKLLLIESIHIRPNGKYLEIVDAKNRKRILDLNAWNGFNISNSKPEKMTIIYDSLRNLKVHSISDKIHGNVFTHSPNYKLKYISTKDNSYSSISVINLDSNLMVCEIIPFECNDFIITTPDNYYTCSKGGYKGVAFRIGNRAYPFEQFDLRLNRPDIILERLGFADSATIKKMRDAYYLRLHKMGFSQQQLDTTFHLPEIELKDKDWSYTKDKREIKIKVIAKDSVYKLRQLNVYNNNVPIYGAKGINLVNNNKVNVSTYGNQYYYFDTSITIPLIKGENKLQFSVLNEGGTESLYETRYVTCTDSSYKPHLYIVGIGVSDYPTESGLRKLGLATNDVDSISNLFSNQSRFDKNRIHKILLKNEQATKDNVLNIKKMLMKTNPADEVIIQFSGHGVLDDSCQFRFANYDINEHNPESTGLNYDAMDNLVDGIPALKKVLFIDACHSGEDITKEDLAKIEEEDTPGKGYIRNTNKCYASAKDISDYLEQLFSDLRRGSGAIVISASRGSQSAFEHTKYSNGVFTHYVLEGIRKISEEKLEQDEDGTVKISELMNYILDSIEKSEFKDKQKPNFRRENIDNDFIIYQK